MTPPDPQPPDDPLEWLRRAQANLFRAQTFVAGFLFEDLCFDAQQAAEKSIIAVLVARGIDFPFVHDLARLLALLEDAGERIPAEIRKADLLTTYAVETRYPGADPVSESEYEDAVALAEAVVAWAEEQIRR
jgi:HEPN domain-containing protein